MNLKPPGPVAAKLLAALNLMQPQPRIGLGVLALVVIVLLYYVWPYLVGGLALIGAVQLYHAWRKRL